MIPIPETDQWKLEGNCGLCRRVKHCNKPCAVHKRLLREAKSGKRQIQPITPEEVYAAQASGTLAAELLYEEKSNA